jgi:oligoendopeptidase F
MPSKKPKKKSFKYTPRITQKPVKVKETWDLTLYYKNDRDPQIEKDVAATESAYFTFAKKWRGKAFTADVDLLLAALKESEAMAGNPTFSRATRYFWLRSCINTKDTNATKQLALIQNRLRKASDAVLFFSLELAKVSKAAQKQFLTEPKLAAYRYYLDRLFAGAAHHLSEPEEKIISLKSRQASGRWVDMTDKIITERHITWKGKSVALPEAIELINVQSFADKPKLWKLIIKEMRQIGEVAEHELNAIVTDARTEDDLRGYKTPYSATVQSYQDSEEALQSLRDVVGKKGFALSRKFYEIKAAYHGVPHLDYSQRNESIGKDATIPFAEAMTICRDVFYDVNPLYGTLFDAMLESGQIDVWPRSGKSGGAFMSAQSGQPINVFLNHVTDFKSLETLAHEMGHAIHARRSMDSQSPFYDGHSIVTAETASTLFENLVFDAVYEQVDDHTKFVLLHDRILRDISTIQRQIAFFNAELDIHESVMREGGLTNEEFAALMNKHLASYLGKGIKLTPDDGYTYVYVSHLRYGFYTYSYAYGLLMSSIMASRFREDRAYGQTIDTFLCSGESKLIKDIYKDAGIDTSKTATFEAALTKLEQDIKAFQKLAKAKPRQKK